MEQKKAKTEAIQSVGLCLGGRPLDFQTELHILSFLPGWALFQLAPTSKGVCAAVYARLPRLEVLDTKDVPESAVKYCRRLRSIEAVLKRSRAARATFQLAAVNAATLTSFEYQASYMQSSETEAALEAILRCSKLTSLSVPCLILDLKQTRRLARACPNLERFSLDGYFPAELLSAGLPLRQYKCMIGMYESDLSLLYGIQTLEDVCLYETDGVIRSYHALHRVLQGLSGLPRLRNLAVTVYDRRFSSEHPTEQQQPRTYVFPALRELYFAYDGEVKSLVLAGPEVEELELQAPSGRAVAELVSSFPALRRLRYYDLWATAREDAAECAALLAQTPALWSRMEELYVSRLSRAFLVRVVFPHLTALRKLQLQMGFRVALPHIRAILARLPRLEELAVIVTDGIFQLDPSDGDDVPALLAQVPVTEEARPDETEDAATRALFSFSALPLIVHPALRSLTLSSWAPGCDRGKTWPVAALFVSLWLPGLRALELRDIDTAGQSLDVTAIVQRCCPAVRRLDLDSCKQAILPRPLPPFLAPAVTELLQRIGCPQIAAADLAFFRKQC